METEECCRSDGAISRQLSRINRRFEENQFFMRKPFKLVGKKRKVRKKYYGSLPIYDIPTFEEVIARKQWLDTIVFN